VGFVLSKVAFLAFLGFAVVMLSGPSLALLGIAVGMTVAVVSVVLPFALIGLLIWLPFYLFDQARRRRLTARQWQQQSLRRGLHEPMAGQWQQQSQQGGQGQQQCQQQSSPPVIRQIPRRVEKSAASTWNDCCHAGRTVGGILMETLCGAAVLGILAGFVASEMPRREMGGYIFVGTALGALFGFLIGLANYGQSRHSLCKDGPRES
jgi:hypothetical protein